MFYLPQSTTGQGRYLVRPRLSSLCSLCLLILIAAILSGCTRYVRDTVRGSAIVGDELVFLVLAEAGWEPFEGGPILTREIVGIAKVQLDGDTRGEMELVGRIELRPSKTDYVRGDLIGLAPDWSFLREKRGGIIEGIRVGPGPGFAARRQGTIHSSTRPRVTPDRKLAIFCGDEPMAVDLSSMAPVSGEAEQNLAAAFCRIDGKMRWGWSSAVSDDLTYAAIQFTDKEEAFYLLSLEDPDSPAEVMVPGPKFRVQDVLEMDGEPVILLSAGWPDRTAYLIDKDGQILAQTAMPGYPVVDSSFERIVFLPHTLPFGFGPEGFLIKIWYPRTGDEEVLEVAGGWKTIRALRRRAD